MRRKRMHLTEDERLKHDVDIMDKVFKVTVAAVMVGAVWGMDSIREAEKRAIEGKEIESKEHYMAALTLGEVIEVELGPEPVESPEPSNLVTERLLRTSVWRSHEVSWARENRTEENPLHIEGTPNGIVTDVPQIFRATPHTCVHFPVNTETETEAMAAAEPMYHSEHLTVAAYPDNDVSKGLLREVVVCNHGDTDAGVIIRTTE